jgi:hypothetical protein
MSAYLVEDKTISRVITSFVTHHRIYDSQLEEIRLEIGHLLNVLPTEERFPREVAKAMHQLNREALQARYPSDWREMVEDFAGLRFEPANTIQTLKSLNCWLYQCAEGDIPETSGLYAQMKRYEHFLERDIVYSLPAYDKAEWA